MKLLKTEPVAVIAVVAFLLEVAVAGLLAAADAIAVEGATYLTVVAAVVAAVAAALARSRVTPINKES